MSKVRYIVGSAIFLVAALFMIAAFAIAPELDG